MKCEYSSKAVQDILLTSILAKPEIAVAAFTPVRAMSSHEDKCSGAKTLPARQTVRHASLTATHDAATDVLSLYLARWDRVLCRLQLTVKEARAQRERGVPVMSRFSLWDYGQGGRTYTDIVAGFLDACGAGVSIGQSHGTPHWWSRYMPDEIPLTEMFTEREYEASGTIWLPLGVLTKTMTGMDAAPVLRWMHEQTKDIKVGMAFEKHPTARDRFVHANVTLSVDGECECCGARREPEGDQVFAVGLVNVRADYSERCAWGYRSTYLDSYRVPLAEGVSAEVSAWGGRIISMSVRSGSL